MKKMIVSLLLVSILLSLAACGKDPIPTEDQAPPESVNQTVETTEKIEEATNETETEEEKSDLLPYSYKVPGRSIVVDVPNYQEIGLGFTRVFILHGIKFVSITADKREEISVTTLEEAHASATDLLLQNIQDYSLINSIEIEDSETSDVNGVEVLRYTGTAVVATDYFDRTKTTDCYTVGYSFIMDGIPCNISAVVMDEAQEADMIKEMNTIVDAMIETLRAER